MQEMWKLALRLEKPLLLRRFKMEIRTEGAIQLTQLPDFSCSTEMAHHVRFTSLSDADTRLCN